VLVRQHPIYCSLANTHTHTTTFTHKHVRIHCLEKICEAPEIRKASYTLINLEMTGLVFKFLHIVGEKINIWTEKDKIMKKRHFVENKTETMQHILRMQSILLLPKYIKWISRGVFYVHSHMWTWSLKVKYSA